MAQETSTTRPGAERAQQIIEANAELITFIETCTDEDWGRFCAGETWPVNVVAHHVSVNRLAGATRHLDGHLGSIKAAVGR